MSTWNLSTLQFRVLWQHFWGGDLPAAFCYQHDEPLTMEQAESLEIRTREELLASLTADQEAMLACLMRATYRMTVYGLDLGHPDDPAAYVRILSGGQPGGYVTIAVQRPGPSASIGGRVQIAQVPWSNWPGQIVRMLPKSPGAGKLPAVRGIDVVADDHAGADRATFMVKGTSNPAELTARRTLCSPPTGNGGFISVTAGTITEDVPVQEVSVEYRDEPGDGRYAYTHFGSFDAQPVDSNGLATLLLRCLRTVKDRREEQLASRS